MAEVYGVTDPDHLPVPIFETLAAGLPASSRSIRKITGERLDLKEKLLAAILDGVNLLVWTQTTDGQKNRNRPKSILDRLLQDPNDKETVGFATVEEFEKARNEILNRSKNNA